MPDTPDILQAKQNQTMYSQVKYVIKHIKWCHGIIDVNAEAMEMNDSKWLIEGCCNLWWLEASEWLWLYIHSMEVGTVPLLFISVLIVFGTV